MGFNRSASEVEVKSSELQITLVWCDNACFVNPSIDALVNIVSYLIQTVDSMDRYIIIVLAHTLEGGRISCKDALKARKQRLW